MSPYPFDDPDHDNGQMAAGLILASLLCSARQLASVRAVTDAKGNPTNQVDVTFPGLASEYRLTVERVP
ncbi:hypothetical protein GCM10029976_090470 [Kribbella albertanoniae]|uniref:Uncharacterized protein n=1 Tax=Kribbella albertanoniae TaxID=1266829 RepID=A0A4R4PKI6_9ACTN|nr:hypothetical protein [Kribbella albertanoniae]TDC22494.1 hypothetical protein E1261_30760 [Kribbella albertanoniae]